MDPGAFVRTREALVQKYQNANMSPERHASYLRLRAFKQRMWRMEDVLAELQALTPASVQVRSRLAVCECVWSGGVLACNNTAMVPQCKTRWVHCIGFCKAITCLLLSTSGRHGACSREQ